MHKYFHKVTVTGRGAFPLDQLRRFEMFPIDIDTACRIEDSFGPDRILSKTYSLGMYSNNLGADQDCANRFASFGFTLKCDEIWKEEDGDNKLFWTSACGYDV